MFSPSSDVAYMGVLSGREASMDGRSVYMSLVRAMLPIVACTTLGLKASTVPSLQNIVDMPNQSAMRIIVPRLPGSCILSSARHSSLLHIVVSVSLLGIGKIPMTCCGCCRKLIFFSSVSDTEMRSTLLSILFEFSHSCVATMILGFDSAIRSDTILGPSATNISSRSRFFFISSERMYLIIFLLIILFFCFDENKSTKILVFLHHKY